MVDAAVWNDEGQLVWPDDTSASDTFDISDALDDRDARSKRTWELAMRHDWSTVAHPPSPPLSMIWRWG